MRHLRFTKFALILFIGTACMLTSCSKDEDNPPTLPQGENTAPFDPVLFDRNLELPAALNSSDDPKAQELVGNFELMTSFSEDAGLFEIPPGAVVSHEPVQTGAGRPGSVATDPNYTVYTYTTGGTTIVYQFSQQNGYDVLEVFYDVPNDNIGLRKYYEIRQSFDDTNGTMNWYVGQETPIFSWTWQINPDDSILITMDYFMSGHYEMMLYPDDSGYLEVSDNEGSLMMEWHWNSDGSGTWTNHQTGESGSW